MKYRKGFPRGNIGSSRYSVDEDIKGGEGLFLMLPDRISGLTVVGHFWKGDKKTPGTGRFRVEVTNSCPENQITGVRITCLEADDHLNVCVTG